ncbi:hypothetical protein B0H10DRAFT_1967937 [Mycena sp. CBHHK59/15]|nr:hypothetical protein B0H10DRAFT_1967937 [Mycena sp. CBHHK59/15]
MAAVPSNSSNLPSPSYSKIKKMQFAGPPPAGTHNLALDETTGSIVAYGAGGKYLGHFSGMSAKPSKTKKRQGVSNSPVVNTCRDATTAEISTIPGWSTYVSGVTVWRPDVWVWVCYDTDMVQLSLDGDPSCSTQSVSTDGTAQGNNLTMESDVILHIHPSCMRFDVQIGHEWCNNIVYHNHRIQTGTQDNQVTQKTTWTNENGKICVMQINTPSCTCSATGIIDLYLTGYIWNSFKTLFRQPGCTAAMTSAGTPCAGLGGKDLNNCLDNNQCTEHGHWALMVDSYVPNMVDRSHPLSFSSAFSSSSKSDYSIACYPIE